MFRSWFEKIDWFLLFLVFGLSIWGLIALKSVSIPMMAQLGQNPFIKQLIFVILGVFIVLFLANVSTRFIYRFSWYGYFAAIFLLLLVLILGRTGLGATRWLQFFGIQFQPSEFAKIAVLLALSRYLSDTKDPINSIKVFVVSVIIVGIPWFLIFIEPDLGTSLVFLSFIFPVLYWANFKITTIMLIIFPAITLISSSNTIALIVVFSLLLIFLWSLRFGFKLRVLILLINIAFALAANPLWNSLKPYQQKRIMTFLDPAADPKGAGYQAIQSMVTIGSGGINGQGFESGSQTQLGFIPEQHTDFIFTIIGEEFGFIGIFAVLVMFLFLIWRLVWIGKNTKTTFTGMVAVGLATILSFHLLVNVGMTLGVMPVTGLPLPFLSFGRSSLVTFYIFTGLALNFYKNRMEY